MIHDLYAYLASDGPVAKQASVPPGLASGLVDECTETFWRNELKRSQSHNRDQQRQSERTKNAARERYRSSARDVELALPPELSLNGDLERPSRPGWLAIAIDFTLRAPWYSKDDRPFHVLDNPIRKDRVFGVPYMSAASWKGLLRWAFHVRTGLLGPAPERDERKAASARAASVDLFGNEKGAEADFRRGALVFYPTWFSELAFEVINPHDREKRAGRQPITYEVVPENTSGVLQLLYAPLTAIPPKHAPAPGAMLEQFLDAAEQLLTLYGFSARRTAGWGVATIGRARIASWASERSGTPADIKAALGEMLPRVEGGA